MDNNQNISNLPIDAILSEFLDEELNPEKEVIENEVEEKEEEVKEETEDLVEDLEFWQTLDEKFFKTNKLYPFQDEKGDDIIPQSYDDLSEVIEANKKHWIETSKYEQKEEVLADIFKETTPAFQFLVQNANLYKSIEDMYPLIQSVQAQEDLDSIDLENEEHQEYVVRTALQMQGFDAKSIDAEVSDLKERAKLASKSEIYKVQLDKIQAERTDALLREEAAKNQADKEFWNAYYTNLNEKLILAKDLGGMVLKQEDKIRVANNLIQQADGSGFPIFSKMDELIGKGDVETLGIISMLLEDRALFDSYYANKTHTEAGKSSARTLRTGLTSKPSQEETAPKVQKAKKEQDMAKSYGVFLK